MIAAKQETLRVGVVEMKRGPLQRYATEDEERKRDIQEMGVRDIEEMGVREMRSHSSDSRFYTGTGSPEQLNATLTRDDSVMSKDEDSRVYGEGEEEDRSYDSTGDLNNIFYCDDLSGFGMGSAVSPATSPSPAPSPSLLIQN